MSIALTCLNDHYDNIITALVVFPITSVITKYWGIIVESWARLFASSGDDGVCGKWFVYRYLGRKKDIMLYHDLWVVHRDMFNKYVIERKSVPWPTFDERAKNYKYKCKIMLLRHPKFNVEMVGHGHHQQSDVFFRMDEIHANTSEAKMYGIGVGIDHYDNSCARIYVAYRKEVSDDTSSRDISRADKVLISSGGGIFYYPQCSYSLDEISSDDHT